MTDPTGPNRRFGDALRADAVQGERFPDALAGFGAFSGDQFPDVLAAPLPGPRQFDEPESGAPRGLGLVGAPPQLPPVPGPQVDVGEPFHRAPNRPRKSRKAQRAAQPPWASGASAASVPAPQPYTPPAPPAYVDRWTARVQRRNARQDARVQRGKSPNRVGRGATLIWMAVAFLLVFSPAIRACVNQ